MRGLSTTGCKIVGALELCPCVAHGDFFKDENGQLVFVYFGGSFMFWDDQRSKLNEEGKALYLDENGDEWTVDQITLAEDLEDETDKFSNQGGPNL